MGSYVEDNLLPSETIVYRARTSMWALFPLLSLGAALMAAAVLAAAYYRGAAFVLPAGLAMAAFLRAYVAYKTTEFAVTDKRVIAKTGLISRNTVEMFLDKVESLNVAQTTAGRLFDYGTVTIRGTGSTDEPIRNISGPMKLRRQFMVAADGYRGTLKT